MNSRESKPVAILNVSSQRGFDEKSGKENISKGKNEENKKHKKKLTDWATALSHWPDAGDRQKATVAATGTH